MSSVLSTPARELLTLDEAAQLLGVSTADGTPSDHGRLTAGLPHRQAVDP